MSCIEGSSLDAQGCSAATISRYYFILFESRSQRALNGSVLLLETAYLTYQRHFYASYGVCFVMVTVRPGYRRLRKAELGLGLGWGCLVSPVRFTHSYTS